MYGKGTLHKIFPREAHVESELSLQTKREFLQQMIPQYRKATTVKKKSKLLGAFTTTTGYNRKYAMWLLYHAQVGQPAPQHPRPAGGPTRTVPGLACRQPHLRQTPHALSPHVCRSGLRGMGTSTSTPECRRQLLSMSAATADRLLRFQRKLAKRGLSTTRAGTLLKQLIPIRTFESGMRPDSA
jgi:hypothetical protein